MSDNHSALIPTFPLFRGFTPAGAKSLLELGEIREYPAGNILFREGDPPAFALLVLTGKLQVFVERDGRDLGLGDSVPGTIVGEISLLCNIPRTASVRAAEASTVLQWNASSFRRLLLGDAFLTERILGQSLRMLIDKERSLIESLMARQNPSQAAQPRR